MATNEPAKVGRQLALQAVHYLRKGVTFADNGTAVTVGVLPEGALILKPLSGIAVTTAFNAGTTNTLNIGTEADGDLYATLISVGTTTFVALDESVSNLVTEETTVTATVTLTGTAATAGAGEVVIAYIPDNDL